MSQWQCRRSNEDCEISISSSPSMRPFQGTMLICCLEPANMSRWKKLEWCIDRWKERARPIKSGVRKILRSPKPKGNSLNHRRATNQRAHLNGLTTIPLYPPLDPKSWWRLRARSIYNGPSQCRLLWIEGTRESIAASIVAMATIPRNFFSSWMRSRPDPKTTSINTFDSSRIECLRCYASTNLTRRTIITDRWLGSSTQFLASPMVGGQKTINLGRRETVFEGHYFFLW